VCNVSRVLSHTHGETMDKWRKVITSIRSFGIIRALLWCGLIAQSALVMIMTKPWLTADSPKYLALAEALKNGAFGLVENGLFQPEVVRPPAYPVLLYIVLHLLNQKLVAVVIVQLALYLFSIFLVERILRKYEITSLPLLLLALMYPSISAYAAQIMTEGISIFLVTLIVFLLATPASITVPRLFVSGVLAGAAILCRPDLLLLPLLLGVAIAISDLGKLGLGATVIKNLAPVVTGCSLLLVPYAVRNHIILGAPSPLPPAGAVGNSLYTATWESTLTLKDFDSLYAGPVSKAAEDSGYVSEVARINQSIGAPAMTPPFNPESYPQEIRIRASHAYAEEAFERMLHNPGGYIIHSINKWWRLFNTAEYPGRLPIGLRVFLQISSALIWLLGFAGTIYLFLTGANFGLKIPSVALLYFPLVHMWLHTEARYTASARLLLLFNASILLFVVYRKFVERRNRARLRPDREMISSIACRS
jgi:hypothetical protein